MCQQQIFCLLEFCCGSIPWIRLCFITRLQRFDRRGQGQDRGRGQDGGALPLRSPDPACLSRCILVVVDTGTCQAPARHRDAGDMLNYVAQSIATRSRLSVRLAPTTLAFANCKHLPLPSWPLSICSSDRADGRDFCRVDRVSYIL